jgi:hypothetical protein
MKREIDMEDKFIHAATADYEALYKDRDMVMYLAELYEVLHRLDPENHHIDAHWSLQDEDS